MHVKESTHYYDRDGTPRYEVRAKDGSMRPATLRDARKFGWYPGVTSIIRCAAAPGLDRWKTEQNILAALTLPRTGEESHDLLMSRIRTDAEEQAKKAREWGTRFHAAIQGHYEGVAPNEEWYDTVQAVVKSIEANFPGCTWVPEKPCAHPSGYGTKADLSSANVVIDFKGSEFTRDNGHTLKTWDEHHMQLAATRNALKKPSADCAICYVSRTVKGLCRIIRVDEPELEQGWQMFSGLLSFWKAKNKYYPEKFTELTPEEMDRVRGW